MDGMNFYTVLAILLSPVIVPTGVNTGYPVTALYATTITR